MLTYVGSRRKAGLVCACALINSFAALYAIPSLLGIFDVESRDTDSEYLLLSTENRQPAVGQKATASRNSSTPIIKDDQRRVPPEFGYKLEPSSAAVTKGRDFCVSGKRGSHEADDVVDRQVSLLILVCSSVENVDRRNVIRSTWGSQDVLDELGVRLVFVLALPHLNRENLGEIDADETNVEIDEALDIDQYVTNEHLQYGDVVQLNFTDSYVNLTLKTVGALRWAVSRCPQTTYVAKADDDVYVNVAALVRRLEDEENRFRSAFGAAASQSFIAGRVIDYAKPVRDRRSKWYTPQTMFDGEFYPPYTSGTGYAMGLDVARRLLQEVHKMADDDRMSRPGLQLSGTRKLFWLEDVYVTGMLASRLDDVRLVHDDGFNSVRRRDLGLLSMSRSRFPSDPSTIVERGQGLRRAGKEDYHGDEEQLAEVCWFLREAITVHDLTPRELTQLWSRLTAALARTTTTTTKGVAAAQSDVDQLCGDGQRQTNGSHGPSSAGADQADALDDDISPADGIF